MKYKIYYTLALLFASLQTFAQSYTYDNLNRLTKVVYQNGTTVSYTYDELGNRTSKEVTGATPPTQAYAWLSSDGKALTFCYDDKRSEKDGTTYDLNMENNYPEWNPDPNNNPCSITSVTFSPTFSSVRPTTTFSWFDMFGQLETITGLKYLNTSEVTDMSNMFAGCSNLQSIDLSHFATSKVEKMYAMFWRCGVTNLDVSTFDTSNVTDMGFMFCLCGYLEDIDVSNFNTSKVTNMENMFSSCSFKNLDLRNFDTSNVQNMYFMFADCFHLESIDVSSFNTTNVENFYAMFFRCISLKSLDVSNFDITSATYWDFLVDELFNKCSSLQSLSISSSMSQLASSACNNVGTADNPCTIIAPEGFDFGVDTSGSYFEWKSGYFKLGEEKEAYAWLSSDGKTLTFCYDNERNERDGETYLIESEYDYYTNWDPDPWNNPLEVTSVIFEPSFVNVKPKSTAYWFVNFKELTSITGLEYLNTSDVTSIRGMFDYCTQLKSIDLSSFDTSNVTDMSWVFCGCSSLESINLNGFDTSNVDNMAGMFDGCTSITSLDLSHFNTSKVEYFFQMFDDCSSLKSLDVTHFDTSSAIGMSTMFGGCSSLTELDVSNFDTSKVIGMDQMFWACQGLTTLDLSNFDTQSVESIRGMFNYCSSLTSLDVSNFDISNVTESDMLFRCCFSLKTLKLSSSMNNIGDDACESVGSYDSPCTLIAPEGFDFGVDTSGSYFEWKSGYFKLASGLNVDVDINGDGKTTISDVTALVNIIQGKDDVAPYIYDHDTADVNHDGSITTADVIELVNIILGK